MTGLYTFTPHAGRVLLCGKISGEEDWGLAKFALASSKLRAAAFEVLNPLEAVDLSDVQPWAFYMELSLGVILSKEISALILLPDWKESRGARIEVAVAREMEIPVLEWFGEVTNMKRA